MSRGHTFSVRSGGSASSAAAALPSVDAAKASRISAGDTYRHATSFLAQYCCQQDARRQQQSRATPASEA